MTPRFKIAVVLLVTILFAVLGYTVLMNEPVITLESSSEANRAAEENNEMRIESRIARLEGEAEPAGVNAMGTVVKSPETLSAAERKDEIDELERYLDDENAISRLNRNEVTEEERAHFGNTIARIAALKAVSLSEETRALENQYDEVASTHEARVEEMNRYLDTLKKGN